MLMIFYVLENSVRTYVYKQSRIFNGNWYLNIVSSEMAEGKKKKNRFS